MEKCRAVKESRSFYPADIKQLQQTVNRQQAGNAVYKEKFIVNIRNQWLLVNTKDIACFYKDALHYIFTFSGEKYILSYESMEDIEALLDPAVFYRANRQAIININAIQSVRPQENAKLTVTLQSPVKLEVDISRDKAPEFRKWVDR